MSEETIIAAIIIVATIATLYGLSVLVFPFPSVSTNPIPAAAGPPTKNDLTEQEKAVETKLVEAWNLFVTLPIEHDDDTDEFRRAIHAASAKVLMRPGRRQFNR